jgi:hypothetical protein
MRDLLERMASKFSDALDLRAKIRDGERELGLPDADLPSEDGVMDYPKRYNAKFQEVLALQDKIRALIAEYRKVSV